jgi:small-conductance mechanosensitive channel
MSERHNDKLHHMDRDACKLFSRGLFLMLTGVLMSVIALLFQPYLTGLAWPIVVLGGISVALLLVFWPGARVAVAPLPDKEHKEAIGD